MGTRLVKSCKRGANIKGLTDQQKVFLSELMADDKFNATNAAKKAGYKMPSQASHKLLKNRVIAATLGKMLKARQDRCELTSDKILNYLKSVLYLNPLDYFYPTEDGGWSIRDFSTLPVEVGQLIDGMKIKVRTNLDGSQTSEFEVQLVSKATALSLAMRHTTVTKHEVKQVLDWSVLYEEPKTENKIDVMLREAEKS